MADTLEIAPPRLIDAQEVARRLGCSTRHVWRMRDAGKMPPPVALNSLVRWSTESIDDWIRRGCPPIRKGVR